MNKCQNSCTKIPSAKKALAAEKPNPHKQKHHLKIHKIYSVNNKIINIEHCTT